MRLICKRNLPMLFGRFITSFLLIFAAQIFAQSPLKTIEKPRITKAQQLAKSTVDDFLLTWLVKKDINKSMQFFHPKAFENKLLLKDSWLGDEWGTHGKKGKRAVSKVISRVLREVAKTAGKAELEKILSVDRFKDLDEKSLQNEFSPNLILLSKVNEDRYILVQSDNLSKIAEEELDWKYITSKYPSANYLACTVNIYPKYLKDGSETIMYFLWAKEGGKWQIILFGVYGM